MRTTVDMLGEQSNKQEFAVTMQIVDEGKPVMEATPSCSRDGGRASSSGRRDRPSLLQAELGI
jgi:hypothetical protein